MFCRIGRNQPRRRRVANRIYRKVYYRRRCIPISAPINNTDTLRRIANLPQQRIATDNPLHQFFNGFSFQAKQIKFLVSHRRADYVKEKKYILFDHVIQALSNGKSSFRDWPIFLKNKFFCRTAESDFIIYMYLYLGIFLLLSVEIQYAIYSYKSFILIQ